MPRGVEIVRLRLATFNLENLEADAGAPVPLAARLAVLRPQLAALAADILCLQEIHGDAAPKGRAHGLSVLEELVERTPYADFARATTRSEKSGGAMDVHNLAILSRHPIVDVRQVRHDLVPPPRHILRTAEAPDAGETTVEWDRPFLYARIDAGGLPVHILNLHLRSPLAAFVPGQKLSAFGWRTAAGWAEGYFLATLKRSGQALEARLLVDELLDADPAAAVAIAGDCNAELRAPSMQLMQARLEDTGNPALAGRVLWPLEEALPPERRYTVNHGGDRVMLDHLLVSPVLKAACRDVDILNEALRDETTPDALAGRLPDSFHAPMVAEFDLAG